MIEKMRKYAFMVHQKGYDGFLKILRSLGVVHVNVLNSIAENEEIHEVIALRKQVMEVEKKMLLLKGEREKTPLSPQKELSSIEEGEKTLAQWKALIEKKNALLQKSQRLEKELSRLEVWGNFEPSTLNQLEENGWEMNFWSCASSAFKAEWKEKYNAIIIDTRQSLCYFITLTHTGAEKDLDAESIKRPERSYQDLEKEKKEVEQSLLSLEQEIKTFSLQEYKAMKALEDLLSEKFNLLTLHAQTEKVLDNRLLYLEGWVPEANALEFEKELEGLGLFFEELPIEGSDKVPIKLKNGAFSKLFEPIVKVYSLPNYFEFDPTPLIAPFFMLFFGLCFGDGGYGLLVLLACLYFKRKVAEETKPLLSLFMYLAGAAVVVGTLTGSFFGVSFAEVEAFSSIKDKFITSDNLMTFSIAIGLFQIVLGKAVAAYKVKVQQGARFCIAPFAWVIIISSLSLWIGLPYLNIHLPASWENIFYGIAGVAFLIMLLYNAPGKNIFLNIGKGLYSIYEVASGLLGDTLSYIRLFALGLTGGILGGVFNSLSVSMSEGLNPVAGWIVMFLILAIGHAMNFGLCMISSLVHPLRLIFVEYYKNSEFEGGGKPYSPYRAVRQER